jgi:hypothetical protein
MIYRYNLLYIVMSQTEAPKKRGRPKKIIQNDGHKIIHKKIDSIVQEDELLLHLKIYDDEPTEKNICTYTLTDEDMEDIDIKTMDSDDTNISSTSIEKLMKENKKLFIENKQLKNEIKKLQQENKKTPKPDYMHMITTMNESKIKQINLNLISIKDNKPLIIEKTNIVCWWCTYEFDNIPFFLPDKYEKGTFYVFGCFCSCNCALAYNIDMNDYRVMVRNVLINEMYRQITNSKIAIPISPKRELLKKFGGILTIDEYRNNTFLLDKQYKMLFPPTIPLLLSITEYDNDKIGK